ncbi:MAG: hypothetical protein UHJ41_06780, partial [Bacteroidaceae bacterium]|nr:hypothetical protein [Bacteroidaceae bacterium]
GYQMTAKNDGTYTLSFAVAAGNHELKVTDGSSENSWGKDGNNYTFKASHCIDNAGSFKVCYRMYPKNENLPHRQDFCYVKWFA